MNSSTSQSQLLPVEFEGAPECDPNDIARILCAAREILAQGEALLQSLSADSYTRCVPAVFNASIGGHYRHCLDHFTSLLLSLDAAEVDYDHRKRDVRVETQAQFALAVTTKIRRTLERLSPDTFCAEVKARCEVSYTHGNSPTTRSTLARELVYCIAHAIHHYALISVMARLMDVTLPAHFGIAPSTVSHQQAAARGGAGHLPAAICHPTGVSGEAAPDASSGSSARGDARPPEGAAIAG
jgi:uncharacterized damage-inducible protein DinB